jgi:hypothetical protein
MAVLVPARMYTISKTITNPGAVSNLVLAAAATKPFICVHAKIALAQATIPASANANVRLIRKTTASTITSIAASTFMNHDPSDSDASLTAGHTATVEGTDGDFIEDGWGATTGWTWEWTPTPEEYIMVPAAVTNGIAIKHVVAPPAGVYSFDITVHEIG